MVGRDREMFAVRELIDHVAGTARAFVRRWDVGSPVESAEFGVDQG